ncbi:hypothetical protein H6G11_14605 [Cyanobacterium aponinum FACHB-4101]|uniref:toxin-antitoxin system TumE family protein n=1 Tax=Cyanobacterium aponinum TaxID=379064 RepID=UPI001680DCCC|nr:DUF6516 family protein [Cyanobacterium aponinum]MBD2395481.1 hypothetical protein [Cyanobacterium aponinum FACHB-4101]
MLVKEYQAKILSIIQKYIDDEWVLSYNFSVDSRSNYLGFVQGKLEFRDGTFLFFKEFIDLAETIEKISYSFHYQDKENQLIFPYDNAKHKPDLGYRDHKHIDNKIIPSAIPDIEEIIIEIVDNYLS